MTATAGQPERGRVLVLDNEQTLTGEVERVGDQYRIKRLLGETYLPVSKALKVCASLEEAHLFLRRRANLHDPSERLRLADWCRQHGLREQALQELEAADDLKPDDPTIRRWITHLRQAKAAPAVKPAVPDVPRGPRVEVAAESLGHFASRVQPILMNACASCHTGGRGGSFQLTRVFGSGQGNRISQERNLTAVLSQINPREPLSSKLLVKAVSAHGPGMLNAPLNGRQAAAYRTLEQWVVRTLDANPHLREQAVAVGNVPVPPTPKMAMSWGEDRNKPLAPPPGVQPKTPPARPSASDPVSADAFNQEFHGEKKD